jgi:hypothetical protein
MTSISNASSLVASWQTNGLSSPLTTSSSWDLMATAIKKVASSETFFMFEQVRMKFYTPEKSDL